MLNCRLRDEHGVSINVSERHRRLNRFADARSFLEYVPGGTIASIYRTPNQAPFEEQLVKFFTAQILEGLAYLHAKHIWHRVSASTGYLFSS